MSEHTDKTVSKWENHIRTISSAIVILLLSGIYTKLNTLGDGLADVTKEVAVVNVRLEQVADIKHSMEVIQKEQREHSERLAIIELQIYEVKRERKSGK